jgi:hypothetical protein
MDSVRSVTMRKLPPITTVLVSAAFVAYQSGEMFKPFAVSTQQFIGIVAASTTATVTGMNPTTFAAVDPPPPVVPPRDRFEQS